MYFLVSLVSKGVLSMLCVWRHLALSSLIKMTRDGNRLQRFDITSITSSGQESEAMLEKALLPANADNTQQLLR